MKLHYMGKYNGDSESLPKSKHYNGSVAVKEPSNSTELGIIANRISIVLIILLFIPIFFRYRTHVISVQTAIGAICAIAMIVPHELLHAICFKKDVYLYTNFNDGLVFIIAPETLPRDKYLFMLLLPNVILGFVPYVIAMLFFDCLPIVVFGASLIAMGAGDYYNFYNIAKQVPQKALIYTSGFNTFWTREEKEL